MQYLRRVLTPQELDALAQDVAAELGVVGAQIAVIADGQLVEGVHGIANAMTGVAVTADTLFQIGSTTKVHTAALVMQLVDEDVIALDTPVRDQLPGFRLADEHATSVVTPRHLMSMSSGIDNGSYTGFGNDGSALALLVDSLAEQPHNFAPGTGFGYSNASTSVSGRLVEHATRQTWDSALRERLLEPAGLHHSESLTEELLLRRLALGHKPLGSASSAAETTAPWMMTRSYSPAGSTLCSTAGDLVRFGSVFLNDGLAASGTKVLSPSSVEEMQEPQVVVPPTLVAEWWGLGPYGTTWSGNRIVGHSGTNASGSSYLLWAPDRGIAVATVVNVPSRGYPFAKKVFAEVFGRHGIVPPVPAAPPEQVSFDPARLVGRYAMTDQTMEIRGDDSELKIIAHGPDGSAIRSALIPLTQTTFLPTDPLIDGGRGWALAFVGDDDGRASHLINGLFSLRRVA